MPDPEFEEWREQVLTVGLPGAATGGRASEERPGLKGKQQKQKTKAKTKQKHS